MKKAALGFRIYKIWQILKRFVGTFRRAQTLKLGGVPSASNIFLPSSSFGSSYFSLLNTLKSCRIWDGKMTISLVFGVSEWFLKKLWSRASWALIRLEGSSSKHLEWKNRYFLYYCILTRKVALWAVALFYEWNEWKNSQFNFSSQNLSLERNFFKWDGKVTMTSTFP